MQEIVMAAKIFGNAKEIYAASFVTIAADTAIEKAYLRQLQQHLKLSEEDVNAIHYPQGET
jgi:uncharacterized membrane protein YebE (DUF533 family)